MGTATKDQEADVLRRLTESPTGEALLAEGTAETLEERKAQVAELAQVHASAETELPAARDAEVKAQAKTLRAWEAYQTALAASQQAGSANAGANLAASTAIERLQASLIKTADPAIDEFLRELAYRNEIAMGRGAAPRAATGQWITHPLASNPNDHEVNEARHKAVVAARQEAEGLKLEALTADEARERLQKLVNGLPG